jgi:GNAT superfamily N-acetyltransferase
MLHLHGYLAGLIKIRNEGNVMTTLIQDTKQTEPYEAARLRWAEFKDTDKLIALYNAARKTHDETSESMGAWLESGGALMQENSSGEILCAVRWRECPNGWQVDRIATRPDARGQGYGRWLMTKVEALAIRSNIPTLNLILDEARDDLLHYYQRMGYYVHEQNTDSLQLQKRVGGVWQYKG